MSETLPSNETTTETTPSEFLEDTSVLHQEADSQMHQDEDQMNNNNFPSTGESEFRPASPIPTNDEEPFPFLEQNTFLTHSTDINNPSPQMNRVPTKRDEIINEILVTEETYINCLTVLCDFYLKKLSSSVITESEKHTIFSNVELLLPVNKEIYSSLIRQKEAPSEIYVGQTFLKLGPILKMYRVYAENYHSATQLVKQLSNSNNGWKKYLSETRKELKEIGLEKSIEANLSLDSLLIMPVQRIPRYSMLLSELLKNTDENHPDYENISEARSLMSNVADSLNQFIHEAEDRNKVLTINQAISGRKTSLVEPHRIFIYEGDLSKITRRTVRACHTWLFNDIVVYSHRKIVTRWQYNGEIELATSWVRDLEDTSKVKNAFQIVGAEKTWTFYAQNPAGKEKWVKELNGVIDKLVQNNPEYLRRRSAVKTQSSFWSAWTSFAPKDYDNERRDSLQPPSVRDIFPRRDTNHDPDLIPPSKQIKTENSRKELARTISNEAKVKQLHHAGPNYNSRTLAAEPNQTGLATLFPKQTQKVVTPPRLDQPPVPDSNGTSASLYPNPSSSDWPDSVAQVDPTIPPITNHRADAPTPPPRLNRPLPSQSETNPNAVASSRINEPPLENFPPKPENTPTKLENFPTRSENTQVPHRSSPAHPSPFSRDEELVNPIVDSYPLKQHMRYDQLSEEEEAPLLGLPQRKSPPDSDCCGCIIV